MLKENITVTLVQTSLFWEDRQRNLEQFSALLDRDLKTDLVVLPEMFTTGFTMNSSGAAEPTEGEALAWMQEQAKQLDACVVGSFVAEVEGTYRNRLAWVFPNGSYEVYDKRHLFRMAQEHEFYAAGMERKIITWKGWRFCPLICYDLRFPMWSRNQRSETGGPSYDCLLYVANWPEARSQAWSTLLKARAIENQCYTLGVNRVGKDGKDIAYSGDSVALDAKGAALTAIAPGKEAVVTVELSAQELEDFRVKFPVILDADTATLH